MSRVVAIVLGLAGDIFAFVGVPVFLSIHVQIIGYLVNYKD